MIWNAKNGSVTLDNTKMSYVSFGYGKKVFVVLPGLSDGLTTVRGKALLLATSYREFFKEYTVYMFSRKNEMPEGYSIQDMAADQAKALKVLGIDKVSIMGVSQGGMIAQAFAIDYPEMVEKLVVVVSAPYANEKVQENVRTWIELAVQGNHKNLMIDTAEKGYTEEYLKKYRKMYPLLGMVGKPKNYNRFIVNARAILGFDVQDELDRIVCPTYIIAGGVDKTVGVEASYKMKEKIAGSELYVYEDLGHAAYEEAKDFYHRVYRWLCKEDREITRLCDLLRKELLNNGYEYGFVVDGKKYKPDMSNGFDEEYYNQAKTMSIVQDPLVTMQEKIGTCVDTVVVMKHLLDAQKVASKIWILYNPKKNKVHTVLTFEAEEKVVYLELTPQSAKDHYGKELVYADENEFLQGYEARGFEVSEITERVVVGQRPEFLLEKLK